MPTDARPAIAIGDLLHDNDPRCEHRKPAEVVALLPDWVIVQARPNAKPAAIQRKRVHTDGKPRRTGFALVRASEPADHDPAGAAPGEVAL